MDPDATYRALTDSGADPSERAAAGLELLVWFARGGHDVTGLHRNHATATAERALNIAIDHLEEHQ